MRIIAYTTVVCWLLASCVQGGINLQQETGDGTPYNVIERDYIAEVEDFTPPAGVDAKLFSELKAALLKAMDQAGKLRGSSIATMDTRSQSILSFDEESQELVWGYYSTGDYDQNGEANVADLTPIALHYSESGEFDPNSIQAVVDGDENGEVNLGDITPIAINFGATTTGFNVYSSASEDDYPTAPGGANGVGTSLVSTVLLSGTVPSDSRRLFSLELDSATDGYYWIRPTDGDRDGTPSTILPLVFSENILPVADLLATPLKGDIPVEVSFDARGSTDEDGIIVKYEFDWDGAANGEDWVDSGNDATVMYTYETVGLFYPLVRVTDDRGDSSTATLLVSASAVGNDTPIASIQADPGSGELPLTVTLDASGSFDADSDIVLYEWDLDGNSVYETDTGSVPSKSTVFYNNQEYECWVRVTDFEGLTDTAFVTIPVTGFPEDWKMFGGNTQRTSLSSFVGPQSNSHKWSHQTGGGVTSSPVIGVDGTVFVGSEDGYMYAINPDGTRKWRYQTSGAILSTPALDQFGNVFFGSMNKEFYALDEDGKIMWRHLTGGQIQSNALVTVEGRVYFGTGDGNLYCISTSGVYKWEFETTGAFLSSPALGIDGNLIIGHSSGKVFGVSPDGTEEWAYQTGSYVASSPAIAGDGTIYIGSNDGSLYALNADGSFLWRYQTTGDVFSSPAISATGNVFVGSRDGFIYSISPEGDFNWRTSLEGEIWSSPTVGSDGTVYIGSNNNRMWALSSAGGVLWSYLSGNVIQSSPAIAHDGTLYVGGEDSFLHAVGGVV